MAQNYNIKPNNFVTLNGVTIDSFLQKNDKNIDWVTVDSFGEEWSKFDTFNEEEIAKVGDDYFDIVTPEMVNKQSLVLDVGCGTGRWTKYIANKVGFVEAIDPSLAVVSAAKLLSDEKNVRVTQASVETIPFENESFDMVFSLGVLHHIPDTYEAIKRCVEKVKSGGYFLVYLYYNLDNRGNSYKTLFQVSNLFRKVISAMPQKPKAVVCDAIAISVYLPFAGLAKIIEKTPGLSKHVEKIPLAYYRNKSFNIIRNDALDRMGTPLEQRFSRKQIQEMLEGAGLKNIIFSEKAPYWHAVGQKK